MRLPNPARSPRQIRTSGPKWWPSDATRSRRLWIGLLLAIASAFAALLSSRRAFHRILPFAGPQHAGASIGRQAFEVAFRAQQATTLGEGELATGISVTKPWTYETDDVWDPLANHDAPITELFVKSCAWPPSFYDICEPDSSQTEDAVKGPWIRVERDLLRGSGVYYQYLFYRRLPPSSSLPTVREVKLLTPDQAAEPAMRANLTSGGWTMVEHDLHSGIWPSVTSLHIWYRTEPQSSRSSLAPYTEFEANYGLAGPRFGFEEIGHVVALDGKPEISLLGRRDITPLPETPPLLFDRKGNFTILQIADLHFSTPDGECRDIQNNTACPTKASGAHEDADSSTLLWLRHAMDQARPDLVILTGDQLNGQKTSWSAFSTMLKVARLFESRHVPWALCFGNHDAESTDASRHDLMRLAESLPYFVGSAGPSEVDGVGNYVLKLRSADASHTHLFTLYFLDSHAYASSLFTTHYDWLKQSQIEWFEREAEAIKPLLRPFVPPDLSAEEGVFDLQPDPQARQHVGQTLRKPVGMAIFHIPLPESFDPPDKVHNQTLKFGSQLEGPGGPTHNSGFFDALQRQTELGSVLTLDAESFAARPKPQVRVLVHGHDHLTDFCGRHRGIWSCFGGGSSYAGYGLPSFDRRVRVFNLQDFGETVRTYKIVDSSASGDVPDDRLKWSDAANIEAEYEAEIEELIEEEMEQEIIAEEEAYEAQRYGTSTTTDLGIERRQRRPIISSVPSAAGRLRTVGGLVLVGKGEPGSESTA